jgi:transposase-like protein
MPVDILRFWHRRDVMSEAVRAVLSGIKTVDDMIVAFGNEQRCRRLFEAMIWPKGRICPACGYKQSIKIAGRDMGRRRARPGLYQCSDSDCRFQFTATTHTPLHSTKLPLSTWLKALWLILQSDKGLSSVRLAEAVGVTQPTAWRMGHALRLLVASETPLGGTVEIDEFFLGGKPKKPSRTPPSGHAKKSKKQTSKKPVLAMVQRPGDIKAGDPAGEARAAIVADRSANEVEQVLENEVEPEAHILSDEAKAFIAVGKGFAAHDTVCHSKPEYVRGSVHTNSVQGFNARVRGTIAGVFHHISPSTPISIFMRWGSDGRSASSRARQRGKPEVDEKPSKFCGNEFPLQYNCRRSFRLQLAVKCAGPEQEASP